MCTFRTRIDGPMKYLSLSEFETHCKAFTFPLNANEVERFREFVYGFPAWSEVDIPSKEVFIEAVQDPKQTLFLRWVEENRTLLISLISGKITEPFTDQLKWHQHQWFEDLKGFITPYLAPVLSKESTVLSIEKIRVLLTFSRLLKTREQEMLQETLAVCLETLKGQLEVRVKTAKSDQELYAIFVAQLTPDFWNSLNLFTFRFYRIRTSWLEFLLAQAYHKHSSRRLMVFLINELKNLSLNDEHIKQLVQLETDLKRGKYVFETTYVPWKKAVLIVLAGLLMMGIVVGIWLIPGETVQPTDQEKTSYMSFTPQERQHMDSLISSEKKQREDQRSAAADQLLEAPVELVLRKTWKNETFRRIYMQWNENDSVVSATVFSGTTDEHRSFPGTDHLARKQGIIPSEIHNNSSLRLLVVVFRDEAVAPVYTAYVSAQDVCTFQLNTQDRIVLLPGGNVPSKLEANKLPFSQLDERFFTNLGIAYRVKTGAPKKIKLVWEMLSSSELFLVDLNGALMME